jgi:hypothetical protein
MLLKRAVLRSSLTGSNDLPQGDSWGCEPNKWNLPGTKKATIPPIGYLDVSRKTLRAMSWFCCSFLVCNRASFDVVTVCAIGCRLDAKSSRTNRNRFFWEKGLTLSSIASTHGKFTIQSHSFCEPILTIVVPVLSFNA